MTFLNQLHFNWFFHPRFKIGTILRRLPKGYSFGPPIEVVEVHDGRYIVQYQIRSLLGEYERFNIGIESVDKFYVIKE